MRFSHWQLDGVKSFIKIKKKKGMPNGIGKSIQGYEIRLYSRKGTFESSTTMCLNGLQKKMKVYLELDTEGKDYTGYIFECNIDFKGIKLNEEE